MPIYIWNGKEFTDQWVPMHNGGQCIFVPLTDYRSNEEGEEPVFNTETILKYYETLSVADRLVLISALKADEITILAQEREAARLARIAAGGATGMEPELAGESAWQIKRDYPDSADGLYWIQNADINDGKAFQVYCDMTTLGGGWTLILQNNYDGGTWNKDNVLALNPTTPPSTLVAEGTYGSDAGANYSIYGWADKIKRSESGFDYMIEAYARGRNGGAWTANQAYKFTDEAAPSTFWGTDYVTSSDGFHQDITEIELFPAGNSHDNGTWTYCDTGVEHRMPWYANPEVLSPGCALVTTTHKDDGAWYGTLVTYQDNWGPAPWIGGGVTGGTVSVDICSPRVIWMWVR